MFKQKDIKIFSNFSILKIKQKKVKYNEKQREFITKIQISVGRKNHSFSIQYGCLIKKNANKMKDILLNQINIGWHLNQSPFSQKITKDGEFSVSHRGDYVFAKHRIIVIYSSFKVMSIDHTFDSCNTKWVCNTTITYDSNITLSFKSCEKDNKKDCKDYRNTFNNHIKSKWKLNYDESDSES